MTRLRIRIFITLLMFSLVPSVTAGGTDGSDLNITPFNTTVLGYSGDSILFTAIGGLPYYSWNASGPLNGILTPNGNQATCTEDWNCSTGTLTGTVTITYSLGNSATATINTSGNDC